MCKVRLHFKTPDALRDALDDSYLTDAERQDALDLSQRFVRKGEFVSIELDIDKQTCEVVQID